jgi:hypothetical protein
MKYILTILGLFGIAHAQLVSPTSSSIRVIKTDVTALGTSQDSVYGRNTSSFFSSIHKYNLFSRTAIADGNFDYGSGAGLQTTTALGNFNGGLDAGRLNLSGSYNTRIGYGAGRSSTGNGNIVIGGFRPMYTQQGGDNNIVLCYACELPNNAGGNQLNIGGAIYGQSVNNNNGQAMATSPRIGIARRQPIGTFEVGGLSGLTTGTYQGVRFTPTINQTGTAGFNVFEIVPYLQSTGSSATKNFIRVGTSNADSAGSAATITELFLVTSTGRVWLTTPPAATQKDSALFLVNGIVTAGPVDAGAIDTLSLSTRAWRQKGDDSLAALSASGVYTPTASAASGITVASVEPFTWTRTRATVTVSGYIATSGVTPGTPCSFELTLPVASNLTTAYECTGTIGSIVVGSDGWVLGSAANNSAVIQWVGGPSAGTQGLRVMFQYTVL